MSLQQRAPIAWWIGELTLNSLGFSLLWFESCSGHMWESHGWSVGFSLGSPFFAHLLMNDQLDISEIFLKGP